MAINDSVLSVRGLCVEARSSNGTVTAVDDLDLEVNRGEVVGLIGESGSGKTTTARAVIGLLERNVSVVGGEIWFAGKRVFGGGENRLRPLRGRHVGVIFQSASSTLNPLLRIGTQLRQVLKAHRSDLSPEQMHTRMTAVIARMGFADPERVLRSYPHQLSGGMRQRAAIAIAVAPGPELLIADECTSALDVLVQADVINLLRELVAESGTSMVFVTHDLLLAADLCSHMTVMNHGRCVEQGTTAQVLTSPRDDYTRRLLNAVPAWAPPSALPPAVAVADLVHGTG